MYTRTHIIITLDIHCVDSQTLVPPVRLLGPPPATTCAS